MRVIIRVAMAATLIVGDAAQAASLVAAGGRRPANGEQTSAGLDPYKRIMEQDEKTWKRVSTSVCAGCGIPLKPLVIARATPLYKQASRNPDAAPAKGDATAEAAQTTQRPRIQTAALQRAGVKSRKAERLVRRYARLAAMKGKHARYARLRLIREHRRLALLQAQRASRALRATQRQHRAAPVRLAALQVPIQQGGPANSGDHQPRPVPLPPRRPDAVCTYDRGLVGAEGQWSVGCVGAQ